MNLVIVPLLVLLLVGVPNLGLHSYGWGPSGGLGLVLVVLLLLMLIGRI